MALLRKAMDYRVGLSSRIALTMFLAMVLVQILNTVVFLVLPRPEIERFDPAWLADFVVASSHSLFAASPSERPALAATLSQDNRLSIAWTPEALPNRSERELPPPLEQLQTQLRERLSGNALNVHVSARPTPPNARRRRPWWPFTGPPAPGRPPPPDGPPPDETMGSRLGPDAAIRYFSIAVVGPDGSEMSLVPDPPPYLGIFLSPPFVSVAAAIVLVAGLSIWTARRSLRPVDQLAAAARRLGLEREVTEIDTTQLRDFAAIGEAFNQMQHRLKSFVHDRTQMLATISHDLRTSLTRLRLTAEELTDGDAKESLIRNMEEMERMIAATLSFAGDDVAAETSEPMDLAALLITICDTFVDDKAEVTYTGPDHSFAHCRPIAMKRALVNIVENAIKYGARADVALAAGRECVVVRIMDRGPGISPDNAERAFRPFSRLEGSRSRDTGGVGLGLSIARDIISSHGGAITLNARDGGGLVVEIRLPKLGGDLADS